MVMTLHCPKCGDQLRTTVGGELTCERGGMPLADELAQRLRDCYVLEVRRPRDVVFQYNGRPHGIGGTWFCPGCGVKLREDSPGDLRCPACERSLVEFVHSLVERHPHLGDSGQRADA